MLCERRRKMNMTRCVDWCCLLYWWRCGRVTLSEAHISFFVGERALSQKNKKVMFSEFFLQRMQYIEGFRCLNLAAQRGSNRSLERLLHKHLYSQESKSTSASANSWLDRTPWPRPRPRLWSICDKNNVFFVQAFFFFF